jgi:hypothetical protein
LFAIGLDHQMWHKYYDTDHWSDWGPLGGYFTSSPGATSRNFGQLDIVGLGTDNEPYHNWWYGQWDSWAYIGTGTSAYFTSGLAVADSL